MPNTSSNFALIGVHRRLSAAKLLGLFGLTEEAVAVPFVLMQTPQLLAYGVRFKNIYLAADERR
jgi:hypothetical protein